MRSEWNTTVKGDNSPRSERVFMYTRHGRSMAYENPQKAPTNLKITQIKKMHQEDTTKENIADIMDFTMKEGGVTE